jgi:carbonic anhydrase
MCERHPTFQMSRRRALTGGGAVAIAGATALATTAGLVPFARDASAQTPANADQALEMLMEGNARYVSGETLPRDFAADRAALTQGQAPFASILSCADSRVAPELAFDQSRGQLFVVRVAGNTLNTDNLASLEFSTAVLGAPLIMVLGHSACGAIAAAIDVVKNGTELPGHLPGLIDPIKPAVEAVLDQPGDLLAHAIEENVRLTVAQIKGATPIISEAVAAGKVRLWALSTTSRPARSS